MREKIEHTLWNKDIPEKELQKQIIPKHLEVDVLIIGGGIAGISTLFELRDEKKNIVLIDKGQVGLGVSSNTTGKLTWFQGLIYHKLEQIFDYDTARLYLESQKAAISHVKSNIVKYQIDCDYMENDTIVFTDKEDEIKTFEKEEAILNKLGVQYQIIKELPIKTPCIYGIKASDSAVYHPLKYLYHLKEMCEKKGINIYEGVQAQTLEKKGDIYEVITAQNTILAHTVIVCTHYPFFVKPGFIPLRTHIENSFIVATDVEKAQKWNAITEKSPIHSFRFHHENNNAYFLYAGESYKPSNHFDTEKRMEELILKMKTEFHKQPLYTWHTHDLITNDSLPMIGPINKTNPNLLIATGFNKWGMTNGVLAGMILGDIVKGKENHYQKILLPYRPINLEKIKNFFVDGYQNATSILKAKMNKDQPFYQNNIKIIYENGHRIGVYRDINGIEHKVSNVCPHMKCNLIFNQLDHTWDCPCHGSRFDVDGNVLEGPSVYSIKLDDKKEEI